MRLFKLDEAIKATWKDTGYTDPLNVMTEIRDRLKALPTVDAVPVVHGRWIKFGVSDKDGNQLYRCSVCECEDIHSPLVKVNYCWNCGARMDGKDGDNG